MFRFLARWVAHCLQIALMLAGALLLMQIPALTHAYTVALLQVAQDARRDIDQREQDARRYYHLAPDANDQAVIAALRPVEPSNAETLQQSLARTDMFDATHALIMRATPLARPLVATWDALARPTSDKLAVLRTSVATYVPQLALNLAAAIYAVGGLLTGGLLGHALTEAPLAMARRWRARRWGGRGRAR
jgi:hypothetical protein